MNTSKDKNELEEQLNQTLALGKMLRESTNQMRRIGFIAIYVGIVATIILIDTIFW